MEPVNRIHRTTVRIHHRRRVLTKYVFPQPVGPVMFAVNGCWKRNPFSTSLVAAAVDIHDCLYDYWWWWRWIYMMAP
jgi:hypothetical protein